jgi:hypothetical protein
MLLAISNKGSFVLLHTKTSMYNLCMYVLCSSISTMVNSFLPINLVMNPFYLIVFLKKFKVRCCWELGVSQL